MHSLKYLNTHFRARYVSLPKTVTMPSGFPGRVTIEELSDSVLLNIFRYYLDVSPRHWPRLVHICRRWRRIVLASQRALHLRVFCTHGTPVLKTLNYWPSLPIVVEYGGSLELNPPAPKDNDNIVAALEQSGRVHSISLTLTSSLLEKFSAIESPFSELEHLVLLSRDGQPPTLPNAFGWSTRLRSLRLTGITFFALPQLLYSSRDLVDLRLHEGLYPWQLPPEAFTKALSRMPQLRSLSLHFLYTVHYLAPPPQSGERIVLPVLSGLNFRGTADYLEGLVTRIDAPRLGGIEVTFFDKLITDVSTLGKFIERTEMHKSRCQAHILSSERAISISLLRPGAPTYLKLQLLREPLGDQLFSMVRICICFSALLSNVEDLRDYQLVQRCKTASCRWESLDEHRACFATTGQAVRNCATFPARTLHSAARTTLCAFEGGRGVIHGFTAALWPSNSGGI
ncbi:hypothetical protein EDB87DRAFT_680717 [Lactarius vividus]|nr:hypothetical protein EDB87DRAFT_680717 [Lactarius vividus]